MDPGATPAADAAPGAEVAAPPAPPPAAAPESHHDRPPFDPIAALKLGSQRLASMIKRESGAAASSAGPGDAAAGPDADAAAGGAQPPVVARLKATAAELGAKARTSGSRFYAASLVTAASTADSLKRLAAGEPLQALCRAELAARPCPQLVLACCTALVSGGGLMTERIFRHDPPAELVDRLAATASGPLRLLPPGASPHAVAALLKRWLLGLPEPLLTYRLLPQWVAAADHPNLQVRGVVAALPAANAGALRVLMQAAACVNEAAAKNEMDAQALAEALAPCIAWKPPPRPQAGAGGPGLGERLKAALGPGEPPAQGGGGGAEGGGADGELEHAQRVVPLEGAELEAVVAVVEHMISHFASVSCPRGWAAMSFAFKKFNFFSAHEVPEHGFPANSTAHVAGGGALFVGTDAGTIVLLDEAWQATGAVSGFGHKVLFLAWAQARQLLVAVGLEEPGISSATLKVWEGDRLAAAAAAASAGAGGPPAAVAPLRTARVFSSKYPESEVTALAVSDASPTGAGLTVAVGVAAGAAYLFTGDAATPRGKAKLNHAGKLAARPDAGEAWRVNALAFTHQFSGAAAPPGGGAGAGGAAAAGGGASGAGPAAGSGGAEHEGQYLHVVTESQTLAFHLADQARTILDQQGVSVGACVALRGGLLLVARDDALYEYTSDTRAGCTAYDGVKAGLGLLRRYVWLLTDDTTPEGGPGAGLSLIDVRNRLVAGSFALPGSPAAATVLVGPGGLAAWAGGRLVRYQEVELASQLELLFKRSLHKLALDLARGAGADGELLAGIHARWGDHLYAKGDYDGAMGQYLDTLGHLEPSYVIRRFLDAQRIHSLTRYLEALHAAGRAGADHTTLLLNCYTKLKDVAKLDAFILGGGTATPGGAGGTGSGSSPVKPAPPGRAGGGGGGGAAGMAVLSAAANAARGAERGGAGAGARPAAPAGVRNAAARAPRAPRTAARLSPRRAAPPGPAPSFDLETAFKVLRSAGYAGHALSVAERAGQPEWVLDVLLEDMGSHAEALAFIGMLSRRQQAAALLRYGKLLIGAAPDDTTALLMDLAMPPGGAPGGGDAPPRDSDAGYVASVADYAHLYADRPTRLLYLCEFVLFNAAGPPPGERALYATLLSLYLADSLADADAPGPGAEAEGEPQARRDKARELLARGWQPHMEEPAYDAEHALVLCRQHAYTPGLVLLYDKKRLHREVLAVHMAAGDVDALIAACGQYGDPAAGGDPQLWAEALEYLVSRPDDVAPAIARVLARVEAGALLPPLVVLQTLAKNGRLQVSLVKGYVSRQLAAEAAEIAKDRETIARLQARPPRRRALLAPRALRCPAPSLPCARGRGARAPAARGAQAEAASMKAEAAKLRSEPHVFQNSRCAASGQPLELPVAHFMCGHSFNLRSLGENERECPLCAPEAKRVLDIRANMRAGAARPDEFFTQLDAAPDGFSVVAEHFGRGLLK
ncbi:VPS11 [Scenedesmus sp. PABB004]|nr:VPS11 [Scenedesmus sp. PABB004]